jgi:hypothetical protein
VTTKRPDEPVVIADTANPRFSADALRALNKATGRTMTELFADEADEVDRFQTLAFFELYRRLSHLGHLPDAAELWDRAGAVEVEFAKEAPRDPLLDGSSTTSPPSVDIGA